MGNEVSARVVTLRVHVAEAGQGLPDWQVTEGRRDHQVS